MSAHAGLSIHCRSLPGDLDCVVVSVSGPLLLRSAGDLRRVLTDVVDAGVLRLLIDLAGVTEIDPGGLATLVVAARRLQARRNGGHLRIVDASAECAAVIRRLHLFTDQLAGLTRTAHVASGRLLV